MDLMKKKQPVKRQQPIGWQRQKKSTSESLHKWRRLVLGMGIVVVVMLVIWGYFIFSFVYRSYQEASEPTDEQVGTYRLQVDVSRFQETVKYLNSRTLY
ncbi:hypothetical protein ACFL0Z_00475 [Patescibacteria group bacterium]